MLNYRKSRRLNSLIRHFFFFRRTTISLYNIRDRYRYLYSHFVDHPIDDVCHICAAFDRRREGFVTFSGVYTRSDRMHVREKRALKLQRVCVNGRVSAVSRRSAPLEITIASVWNLHLDDIGHFDVVGTLLDVGEKIHSRESISAEPPLRVVYIHHGKIFLRRCGRFDVNVCINGTVHAKRKIIKCARANRALVFSA